VAAAPTPCKVVRLRSLAVLDLEHALRTRRLVNVVGRVLAPVVPAHWTVAVVIDSRAPKAIEETHRPRPYAAPSTELGVVPWNVPRALTTP